MITQIISYENNMKAKDNEFPRFEPRINSYIDYCDKPGSFPYADIVNNDTF